MGLWWLEWVQWGWGVGLLPQVLLLELQELLGMQVQDGVRGRGHLHLAEQHCTHGALLAVVHLLLQHLYMCQEGLQYLEVEIRQDHVNSCCSQLTGPSKGGAAHPTHHGLTHNSGRLQTHPYSPAGHAYCQLSEVNILVLETSSPEMKRS